MNIIEKFHLKYICIAFLIGFLEYRCISFMQEHNFEEIVKVNYGPLVGRPFWRVFQNRLLSLYILKWLSVSTGISFTAATKLFNLFATIGINIIAYWVFFNLSRNKTIALRYMIYVATLFLVLQDYKWLLAWDYTDVMFFLLFAYGIFLKKQYRFFVILYIFALLNRESALFIAAWLIIDSISFRNENNTSHFRVSGVDVQKLLVSGVLLISGIIYTKLIRDLLFIKSSEAHVGYDLANKTFGNMIRFSRNFDDFFLNIFRFQRDIVSDLFLVFIISLFWLNREKLSPFVIKFAVLIFGMVLSIFLFGLINETRLWLTLIPMIAALHYYFYETTI